MKTQLSRNSFKTDKRYSGVYQQQGRMITDADWNNLVDIFKWQLAEALKDLVGSGSPRTGALTIDKDRRIVPGDLVLDGLRAELPDTGDGPIPINDQPDFPGAPELPDLGTDHVIYADVWERSLTSLEDPELRDTGLNGADTCTRTRTMLQVKISPSNVDPETDIPRQGDAKLLLELHANPPSGDSCDPCAGQVGTSDGSIGNYLFRLETHAAEWTGGHLIGLTLKWSSENGAEQHEALEELHMPPGFVVSNGYVYEFFDLLSEARLGVNVNPKFDPIVPELVTTYVLPEGATDPKAYVRRWDGYCKLVHDGSSWSLVEGIDRGVDLSTPGRVFLNSTLGIMNLNLEALKLTLELNRTFVTGDYWLAPVREAQHGPGSIVLESDSPGDEESGDPSERTGAPPQGIAHHYLRLARVTGGSVEPYDDDADEADKRRHNFPPLTDLQAFDVGYRADCDAGQGLFQNFAGTVKEALDKVCDIQAGDVGFTKTCDDSIYKGKKVATVQDALHLLCDVKADQIRYQPGPDSKCTFLKTDKIGTVQEALESLCIRPSGGCKVTVGPEGHFKTVEAALKELLRLDETHICICLLPGRHDLTGQTVSVPSAGGIHLSLSGCGASTELHIKTAPLHLIGFHTVSLKDLEIFTHDTPDGGLVIEDCRTVSFASGTLAGVIGDEALIRVGNARSANFHDLMLEAADVGSLQMPTLLLGINPLLAELFEAIDRTVFEEKAALTAKALAALGSEKLRELSQRIDDEVENASGELTDRERSSYHGLAEALRLALPRESQITLALQSVRIEAVRIRPASALAIADADADWSLRDCDILGRVVCYGNKSSSIPPDEVTDNLAALVVQNKLSFSGGSRSFKAAGCRITRMELSDTFGQLLKNVVTQKSGVVPGLFSSGLMSGCTLLARDSYLAFLNNQLSSNVFPVANSRAAVVMGDSSIYVGNRGGGETEIVYITPRNRTQRAANLGLDIKEYQAISKASNP